MPKAALSPDEVDATRGRLLAATARLIASEGYPAFSMRRLGQACGLTAGALYRYFPTRHAILTAYWSSALEALRVELAGIAERPGSHYDRLLAMTNAYVAFALEDADRFRLLFMESDRGELGEFGKSATLLAPFDVAVRQVGIAIEAGVLKPMPPAIAAQILWASAHGILTLAANIEPLDLGDVAALADLAARVSLDGLTQKTANT